MTAPSDNVQPSQSRKRPRDIELWDITPVMLGGNPQDPANKTWLKRQQHIQAVRYWNKVISDLRAKQGRG